MTTSPHPPIDHGLLLHCDGVDGRPSALSATFGYEPDDPWAVRMTFHGATGEVVWMVARSLLEHGLSRPVGEGDVRVSPHVSDDGALWVDIELRSPTAPLRVRARLRDVVTFLVHTWERVPIGTERIDHDALVTALLAD